MWNRGGGGGADCRGNVVLHPFQRGHNGNDTGLLPVGEQDFKFHEDIASRERARLKYVPCLEFLGRKERCLLLYSLLGLEILTMLPSEGLPSAQCLSENVPHLSLIPTISHNRYQARLDQSETNGPAIL